MKTQAIGDYSTKFDQVVDHVLDNASDVLNNGLTEANLASLESIKREFTELRNILQCRSSEFPDRQIVEADYFALQEYQNANPSLKFSTRHLECSESGRIIKIVHSGRAETLAPLEMLAGVESLVFMFTRVEDSSPLSSLPLLKNLSVKYEFLNTRNLGPMVSLESFEGSSCWMHDLKWILRCPQLKRLTITDSGIKSIGQLNAPDSLEFLDLSYNKSLKSIAALAGHPTIQTIWLQKTAITDLSPLLSLPSLGEVRISEGSARLASFAACQQYLHAKGGKMIIVPSP